MNDEDLFYKGERFQIYQRSEIDPIVWDDPSITALSEALIAAPANEKNYFFSKSFKGRVGYIIPNYFLDPKDTFNPTDKAGKSELFNVIETYTDDNSGLKEFVVKLIEKKVLVKDSFSVLKCNKDGCDKITIGTGSHCNACGKQLKENSKRQLYHMPRIIKDLFHQQGKIIEGVVYHSIKSIANDNIKIGMNRFFKEEGFVGEIDISIKNKSDNKIAVIHITTAPRKDTECSQFTKTLSHSIKTIFVTTGEDGSADKIKFINKAWEDKGSVYWNIANDPDFFNKLNKEIKEYII